MFHISKLLKKKLTQLHNKKEAPENEISVFLKEKFGSVSYSFSIKNQILYIKLPSSSFVTDIYLREKNLLDGLNKKLTTIKIKKIKLLA